MSGSRHHFIPRFLLRGFASHTVGEDHFAWVVRRDRPPFKTNIKNIAVEGHFYTLDGSPALDNVITSAEANFANVVRKLRASPDAPIVPHHVARLLAHLEARTRHLRKNFEVIAASVAAQTVAFIKDYDAFKKFLIDGFERDPESLIEPLRKAIERRGITPAPTEHLLAALRPFLPRLVEELLPSLAGELIAVMEHLSVEQPDVLSRAASHGQLRGLETSLAPISKVAEYEKLSYAVRHSPRELVLGDSAVLFEIAGARQFTTFISEPGVLMAAYLPLTPHTVLVGCRCDHCPDLERLPEAIAQCAQDYFVAASDSAHVSTLQPLLGSLAMIIEGGTIERLIAEALRSAP